MSRWAEANKSRSVDISITRRPGSKGTKTNLSKKRTPPIPFVLIGDPWSAALLLFTAIFRWFCSFMYFVSVSILPCCTYCVLSLSRMCATKRARKGWSMLARKVEKEDEEETEHAKMQGGMSDDKKEYDPIWARARRHSDGENAPYLLFNYRFIAWSSDRWRHDVYRNTWCGSASITAGSKRETGQRAPICLQGITVAHAWARGKVFRTWNFYKRRYDTTVRSTAIHKSKSC